jgi:predicted ATPase
LEGTIGHSFHQTKQGLRFTISELARREVQNGAGVERVSERTGPMATELSTKSAEPVDPDWTKPAFLRRVRIRGFKSIAYCDVPLQPLTILVGRNAAGKSNFLDALAFLRDTVSMGVSEAVKRRGGWRSVATRRQSLPFVAIEIEASFVCGRSQRRIRVDESGNISAAIAKAPNLEGHSFSARYSLHITGDEHAAPVILVENLDITDNTAKQTGGFDLRRTHSPSLKPGMSGTEFSNDVLSWNGANAWTTASAEAIQSLSVQRSDSCFLEMLGFQPFLELSEGLRSLGLYNFHPNAIRRLQPSNPGHFLDKEGANLASVIKTTNENEPESVQRVRDYVSTIADEVEDFGVIRYGEYETVQFRLKGSTPESFLKFDAASMSDGTLRILATLMAAFQIVLPQGHPALIGIEEPEASLHPAAMRALVDALDEATQWTQVLVTTHSADLLSDPDITPGQVLVVRKWNGQTQITPLGPASREIVKKELNSLAELQRMDRLDIDESDLSRQAGLSNGKEGA